MEKEKFEHIYDYIIDNNIGDKNPYHNNEHLLFVYKNAMNLFSIYKKEYELKYADKNELGYAALFHDFNHSGGKLKDNENIDLAIKGFNKYVDKYNIDINTENVTNIIISTEFPHKDIELDILKKIIRDSDTIGGVSDNWFEIVTSLSNEYGKTFSEFIPIQLEFLDSVKFNLPYSNDILNKRKTIIKNELLKIKKVYNEKLSF